LTSSQPLEPGFQLGGGSRQLRFTVRRPTRRWDSPRGHRPPGGDVLSCVEVSVGFMPAVATPKHRLALAVLLGAVTTGIAGQGCVGRLDLLNAARGFVLQTADQPSPGVPEDGTVQTCLLPHVSARQVDGPACRASHVLDSEVFDPNQVESAREIGAGLLDPILSPVSLTRLQPGDRTLGPLAAVRSGLSTGQLLLQSPQPANLSGSQSRTDQRGLTGGQRHRCRHTDVHTDNLVVAGSRDGAGFRCEGNMPPARSVAGHSKRLRCGYLPAPAKSNPANLGDPHRAGSSIEPANLFGLDGDNSEPVVTITLAPRRSSMGTVEVVGKRLREVSQRLLLHHLRAGAQPADLRPGLGQLTALLDKRRRRVSTRSPVLVLLDGQIPNEPRMRAVLQERSLLHNGGLEPVTRHVLDVRRGDRHISEGRERRQFTACADRAVTLHTS
jgi:hypothetical protein